MRSSLAHNVGFVVVLAVLGGIVLAQQRQLTPEQQAQQQAQQAATREDHQRMLKLLNIKELRPGASGSNPQAPNYANYDEAKVLPYPPLPDPLTLKNGKKVTSAKMWWNQRRAEIVEDFDREMYGRMPKVTPKVKWEVTSAANEVKYEVPVITKQLIGHVDNSSYSQVTVDIRLTLTTPANATGPVPVIMEFGFGQLPPRPAGATPPPANPNAPPPGIPWQQQVLAKGWGYATLVPNSIQADNGAGLTAGIIGLVNKGQPRKPDDWGALRAWGWGASRALDPKIEEVVTKNDLIAASVLSGNRNFEARVHQSIKANFLMSPPLVVAFALAGRINIDMSQEPLGIGRGGQEVYLKDIWPTSQEIAALLDTAMNAVTYERLYADFTAENPLWNNIPASVGNVYEWDASSTYIQQPPFFESFSMEIGTPHNILQARALGIFGDSVTTDHISPAGSIKASSPAGLYLQEHGVVPANFNSYGSRRGNDRVMTRGTFANVRIKNLMVPGVEGGVTKLQPGGEQLAIYDAAMKYKELGTPLVIFAGQEYGTGSSRDWAAKGTALLGVKAVVAQSFERIHRSNLVGMGVLPLQFKEGVTAQTLALDGTETFDITGLDAGLKPRQDLTLTIHRQDGSQQELLLTLRIDTPIEVDYYQHGGILPYVLRQLVSQN